MKFGIKYFNDDISLSERHDEKLFEILKNGFKDQTF